MLQFLQEKAVQLLRLTDISADSACAAVVCMVALYVSCGLFCNVSRVVKKLTPFAIVGVVYYRIVYLTSSSSVSLLQSLLGFLHERSHLLEIALFDCLLLWVGSQTALFVVDRLVKLRYISFKTVLNNVGRYIMKMIKCIPMVQGRINQEFAKIEKDLHESIKGSQKNLKKNFTLPVEGIDSDQLIAEMKAMVTKEDKIWQKGQVSGAVYHGDSKHIDMLNQVYALFSVTNPLHVDIWPSVMKFEAEVISMTANLVNGGNKEVCGVMTSGGTESIVMAAKTHRDWFNKEYGITQPEIICANTAHAAIDKACEILGIKLIKVPCKSNTFQIDLAAVRWNISANTIMIYSSAPNFPQGTIDDIESLSKIAMKNNVGLHVDCCLGGFIVPFASRHYKDLDAEDQDYFKNLKFDFSLHGVTSMSVDTHKYGYAAKGTSIVLYRNKYIRRYQYFTYADWTGGLYVTPTIAGSRAGALSACAWASLMKVGENGFTSLTRNILRTARLIRNGIESSKFFQENGIYVLGDPRTMVVCFSSKTYNIFRLGNFMTKQKDWSLNSLQHPASIHICITKLHIGIEKKFLSDLKEATEFVKADPKGKLEGGSALYGMAASMPAGPVEDIMKIYTDTTYTV